MEELSVEEKEFIKKKLEKKLERKENRIKKKIRLVEDVIDLFRNDLYSYEGFIFDLCRETLIKRTNQELKDII